MSASWSCPPSYRFEMLVPNPELRNCIPIANKCIGTWKHDIEYHLDQGAVAFAKIMKEATLPNQVMGSPSLSLLIKHNL